MESRSVLKTPATYINEEFIRKQNRNRGEIPLYKAKHACKLAEERFMDILRKPTSELETLTSMSNYQKGILITQNGEPRAILKKHYQDLVLPFENNQYREGIYWLDKQTYQDTKEIELQKGKWGTIDIKKLNLFPVRPLQGPNQETLRSLLEEEYQIIKTDFADQAYQLFS